MTHPVPIAAQSARGLHADMSLPSIHRKDMTRVWVVDDDAGIRFTLEELLTKAGHTVRTFERARDLLPHVSEADLVLTDLAMPEMDGLALLRAVQESEPQLPVIMLTAFGSERVAVNAIKAGAYDYIAKPFDTDDLLHSVARALETVALKRENRKLTAERAVGRRFVAESQAMRRLLDTVDRVAMRDVTVLLRGETGTGKEAIATLIHTGSERRNKPLVRFNCAAIPRELAESELFGHKKGAFTGADDTRAGYFRKAHGGTLVLDEIGELPLGIQAKLLRAVQLGEVQQIGASSVDRVDVRIVASTHRDLLALSREGKFREDLYYRLAVVDLVVPPLRDRKDDIGPLAREFARDYADRFGLESDSLPDTLVRQLEQLEWPGNVRQLENCIARLAALSRDSFHDAEASLVLQPSDAPTTVARHEGLRGEVAAFERGIVQRTLQASNGNMSEAARRLKIGRATLFDKVQKYGIDAHGKTRS